MPSERHGSILFLTRRFCSVWFAAARRAVPLPQLGPEMVTKIFVLILLVLFIYFAMNSLPIILTIVGTRGLKR